jgi:glycosidase
MSIVWYRRLSTLALLALLFSLAPLAPPPALAQPGTPQEPSDAELVRDPIRNPNQSRVFYFVMPDRFANGDTSNDFGGLPGGSTDADVLRHGFAPTRKGYYHGGDLKGLMARLDYLKGLGISAIWMTPMFKNRPVQANNGGVPTDLNTASAGYHGYWITDFTQIDPHFGTNAELEQVIDEAHARDMKVFFDIITNHTADIITLPQTVYRPKTDFPYRDANGNVFDDAQFAGRDRFPALDPQISFPYTPTFLSEADKTIKKPDWLNNPIYYHNRGDFASAGIGEKALYGDFFVLDDLFTEHPRVVEGMTEIYRTWVRDYDIDGFRIDTVKHVNVEFWQKFIPEIDAYAKANGKPEFFMFGEVFDSSPEFLSRFTTEARLESTLDFGFQSSATAFANGGRSDDLRDFFANDDYYTDADSNAYSLPTFLGNHDMGRIGRFIATSTTNVSATEQELLERDTLAHALMFFARGMPVIYYGDEQGFTGDGGDQDARQNMTPSQVPSYLDDNLIGTTKTHADDNFDPNHPLYKAIAGMSQVRGANKALQFGHQIARTSSGTPGVFAFSRIDRDEKIEYVVALNNAKTTASTNIKTFSPNQTFTAIFNAPTGTTVSQTVTADVSGTIALALPPFGAAIYKAAGAVASASDAPTINMTAKTTSATPEKAATGPTGRFEVAAELGGEAFAEVTFAAKVGNGQYQPIGTDTNAPYRVFYDGSKLAPGTKVTFKAVVKELTSNKTKSATIEETIGLPPGSVCPAADYAIIHYQRSGSYAGAAINISGSGIDASETLSGTVKPFLGEDSFGRFAFVKLSNPFQPLTFTVQISGTNEQTYSFVPAQSLEVWVKQGDPAVYTSQTAARGNVVTIHYQRPAGDYNDSASTPSVPNDYWGLHLFGDAIAPSEVTQWPAPKRSVLTDTFGAVFTVSVVDGSKPVNFIVHTPSGDEVPSTREPGGDRGFTPDIVPEIWLKQGDAKVYPSRAAAEAGVISATIRYRRPAGDYGNFGSSSFQDYWSLYTWTGARNPSPSWELSAKPSFTDTFGIGWTVPLTDNATQLNYIVHKGDEKQPPGNQELVFAKQGYDVWLLQDREPYLLPKVGCLPINNTITADAGATYGADGSIGLQVPSGAVTSTLTLAYNALNNPARELTGGRRFIRAFRLNALDANLNQAAQFPLSYTLTISYTEAELAVANVLDEATLRVVRLGSNGETELLPQGATVVDAANNRITISATRLGDFALVGRTGACCQW